MKHKSRRAKSEGAAQGTAKTLELTITDLSRGGAGVARTSDGQAVFVPFTLSGDRVRVQIVSAEKRYLEAKLLEILAPSVDRVEPPCPVFTRCGGCQWQHIPYPIQWRAKARGVVHALARVGLGEVTARVPQEDFPAADPYGYRNRIQLRGQGREFGFFEPASRKRVPIEHCEIARPEINSALPKFREQAAQIMPPDREFKLEIEVLEDGQTRAHWNARHAAGGFRQVNDAQNARLCAFVRTQIEASPPRVLLDLFGGNANLSKGLIGRVPQIHCVDIGVPSDGPAGIRFHKQAVADWLSTDVVPQAQVAILDPPREGLGPDFTRIVQGLERRGVERVIHVGCSVDAWSSDLAKWHRRGWQLIRVAAIDLFPQTPHVEAVAVLVKGRGTS